MYVDGLINGGDYIRGAYNRNKKTVLKRAIAVLIEIRNTKYVKLKPVL